jgi:hypothetical protein
MVKSWTVVTVIFHLHSATDFPVHGPQRNSGTSPQMVKLKITTTTDQIMKNREEFDQELLVSLEFAKSS